MNKYEKIYNIIMYIFLTGIIIEIGIIIGLLLIVKLQF